MAKKDQQQAELKRESRSRAEPITLRLDEIRTDKDRFCHRDPAALEEKNLKPLMESLVLEGQLETVEVFQAADGQYTLIRGHRRVTAMHKLAEQNMPGFTADMPVRAHLVRDASPADLIVRSVGDNMNRSNLAAHERIRAAKTLFDAKVPKARAARALSISETSYDRALLIAMHPWMYDLVAEKSIDPTPAFELLQAAQKKERLRELQEDLGDWVAARKLDIRRKQREKADVGKELSEVCLPTKKCSAVTTKKCSARL
jgi:ParB-like chromosome segregation protein Spo0J